MIRIQFSTRRCDMRIAQASLVLAMAVSSASAIAQDKATLVSPENMKAISNITGGREPDEVTPSGIPGVAKLLYGGRVLFVDDKKGLMFQGALFDLKTGKNLTDQARSENAKKLLASIDDSNSITFAPDQGDFSVVTVFTDIDCPYCAKLHRDIAEYNKKGIAIRYLFFPRAGIGSPSYDKAVSVWCSDDRKKALTMAKAGQEIPKKTCDNPVATHFKMGRSLGVTGTPTMVLENGKVVVGYRPPASLARVIAAEEKKGAAQK